MSTEPQAGAKPEGGALSRVERVMRRAEQSAEDAATLAIQAVERWYAKHFHAAAVAGRAPISADDKAALIQHVADALAPAPKE